MAYSEQTTVNSHKHLLDLFETFLIAQGWTVDSSVDAAERELYVHKAHGGEDFFFVLKSTGASSIVLNADLAFPTSSVSGTTHMNLKSTAMVRAWFVAGDLYAYIIVEVASGYYQMCGFGRLEPYTGFAFTSTNREGAFILGNNNTAWSTLASFPGSQYLSLYTSSSTRTNHVRYVPVAGVGWGTPDYSVLGYDGNLAMRDSWMLSFQPNTSGLRGMLRIPIRMPNSPAVTAGYQNYFPLGFLPDMRVINMHEIAAASEETLGADVWKRFPSPHQNNAITALSFGANTAIGFAFLK